MTEADEPLGRQLERVIGEAIYNAVGQHEKAMVTKWVALVESIDTDGARGVWTMTSDDVKSWDTLGLLQYGLALQNAQIAGGYGED